MKGVKLAGEDKKRRLPAVSVGDLTDADDLEGIEAADTVYESIFSKVDKVLLLLALLVIVHFFN
jgi:hypothetical protein